MDKAKAAVQGFLHKNGAEDTTVHETTNAAVQNERVTRTQHNEQQTAIDREVHQDVRLWPWCPLLNGHELMLFTAPPHHHPAHPGP